jgi:uncharacterized protein
MKYGEIKKHVLERLEKELDPKLTYHGVHHTNDVIKAVIRFAEAEKLADHDVMLLKTAAVFHDMGFLVTYIGHEEESVKFAKNLLPQYDYNDHDIKRISGMIKATQIPQRPKTILEEILCDADLDYLGRNDFIPISMNFFKELLAYGFISDEKEFNYLQLSFLESHSYWRKNAMYKRGPKKQRQLERIRKIVETYSSDDEGDVDTDT